MRVLHTALLAAGFAAFVTAASAQSQPVTTNPGVIGTPAPAGETGSTAPAAANSDPNDDTVSCRYEKITGSNFTHRICHTQREWKQINDKAKDFMNNLDRGSQGNQIN
ncbi:MAG TPA: hypothetical protein VG387_02405 [Rhizomicrobium sp.]|jgi:hypothetical protein|nr:hypothetical protein [Rhizomicrobium sp.]